jgi:ribosomal protein S18 acetylase RimI-like enzyme
MLPIVVSVATIELLGCDLVTMAQCMVIDAEAFPHPSAWFGSRSPYEVVWLARGVAQPRVLGFLAAQVRRDTRHVEGVAVERAARRQGIGRSLLRTAINSAVDFGVVAIVLCVSVTNDTAIALYETEGFTVTRRLHDFYSSRAFGGQRDALEMSRARSS